MNIIITYTDGTTYEGNSFKGGWNGINDTKEIFQFEYIIGNSHVTMNGFKEYNHFKEHLGLQVKGYSKIILMGRTSGNSLIIEFDLLKKQINKMERPYGKEYGIQILSGWKKGKLTNPKVSFKKLDKEK